MKKLSVLIALMLCVTIGGVYAVWSYAGTNDIADAFAEAKVTMADVELTGANGTYHIESNLVLTVDQKAPNDHTAVLKFSANNNQPIYLKVTFTPATNAPAEIKANGVPSELYFGTTAEMKYDGVNIFEFTNPGDTILNNIFDWAKESDGTFTYTLDENALKGQIQLSPNFVLDTKAKYDEFRQALSGNIVARVTDGTVNN